MPEDPSPATRVTVALSELLAVPGVAADVDRARDACTQLRWHPALRRRIPEAAAESRVRGARASALLDGADVPLAQVRDLMRGASQWQAPLDPVEQTLRAAVQATAESEHVRIGPVGGVPQALARLHAAAGAPLLPDDQVGRPRRAGERAPELVDVGAAPSASAVAARLAGVQDLVAATASAPALIALAVVHAELAVTRPFVRGNAIVARAFDRALLRASGVDPTGVVVPEVGHHREGVTGYVGALQAYATGTPEGVALWLQHSLGAVCAGAAEGVRIADAVLAGRLGEA